MDTTVSLEEIDEEAGLLASHEILRENLKKSRKKRAIIFSDFRCKECGKILCDKASLEHHIQTHSTVCLFYCKQCPYKGKTRKYLNRHVARLHRAPKKVVTCKYCNKQFRFKANLVVHERTHTGEKPNKCDVCGKSFSAPYSLATHKFIHTDEKPFKCLYCEYACRDSSTLRRHHERHLGIKRYTCDFCKKGFDTKTSLTTHVRGIHTAPDERSHECEECGNTFKTKGSLRSHKKLKHSAVESTYECVVCCKVLRNAKNMRQHMMSHVTATPYSCAHAGCKAKFKSKHDLKKHAIIHYPEKHVTCAHCGRSFSRKERLAKHIRKIHDRPNKKTHRCLDCGVCFLTKNYLSKHMRQKHSRNRPRYECDMCGFTTYNKPSIVMHIKHGHDNSSKTECKICGKSYKRNVHLKLHYKNTHDVRFKTKSRKIPKIQIKEEPLDRLDTPDMEIDLLDIDKEEPITEYETEYMDDVLNVYKDEPKSQYMREVFKKMIHDPDYESSETRDPTKEEIENQTADVPQNKAMPIEELIQQDMFLLVVGNENMSGYNDPNINMDEAENRIDDASQNEECNQQDNTVPEMSEENGRNKTTSEDLNKESNPVTQSQIADSTESSNNLTTSGNRTSMPVEEFIQQVVDKMDDPVNQEEKYTVDEKLQEHLEQKIRELVLTQRRNENDTNTYIGRKIVRRIAPEDIIQTNKVIRARPTYKQFKTKRVIKRKPKIKRTFYEYEPIVEIETEQNEIELGKRIPKAPKYFKIEIEKNKKRFKRVKNEIVQSAVGRKPRKKYVKKKMADVDDEEIEKKSKKLIVNLYQCNVCYKLFETRPQLLEHCQVHFDLCTETKTLIKCPLCDYVAEKGIIKHFKTVHKEDISISFLRILNRAPNENSSRYYYNTENEKAKEIDIIPSVKILNKKAGMDIDKMNRERKNKTMSVPKLVRKGNEWVVEKEKFDVTGYVLPNEKELNKDDVDYLKNLRTLWIEAKNRGAKMLFPCNKCEKVCQNLSALTLHTRKHNPDKKPFAPKVYKYKIKDNNTNTVKEVRKCTIDVKNRTAKPKPIVNNHKCDPKLREFYENNIRGLNIEFWQFLKIYNKMERDDIQDFDDLTKTTDYGLGHVNYLEENHEINNTNDNSNKNTKPTSNEKTQSVTSQKNKVANVKNRFTRTIRISRKEHNKRKQLQKELRAKLANPEIV